MTAEDRLIAGQQIDTLAGTLARDGVVAVEGYLPAEQCDAARTEVEQLLEDGTLREAPEGAGYNDMAGADEPILNRRGGRDAGMIDVFNLDRTVPALAEIKSDERIEAIVNGADPGRHFRVENLNVYVNRSVKSTRGFHADTYAGKYKSFVYLTDVPDASYGPFAYVRGSHQPSRVQRKLSSLINKVRGARPTDGVFYRNANAEAFTAPRGTLIIANQAGLHRGTPQAEGHGRMLVSTSYMPV